MYLKVFLANAKNVEWKPEGKKFEKETKYAGEKKTKHKTGETSAKRKEKNKSQ